MNNNAFNRFLNLDSMGWRIVDHLLNSDTKHAENLWKTLKYDTEDCLFKNSLTRREKIDLIYRDTGNSANKKVFLMPYTDDAWETQSSRLDIYVDKIISINHITSRVNIGFEILVHNKINNIYGEAEEGDPFTNPSELDEDGNPTILTKSRDTVLLRSLLAELNGAEIAGVGMLQFNSKDNPDVKVERKIWNNRAYFGYFAVLTVLVSGVSSSPGVGW